MRILLILALAQTAAGTTVVLTRDGAAVERGEVCRFQALDRENPFRRWLASQEVTCVAAGSQIEFPRGLWNVFARAGTDAVSAAPLLIDGDRAPATLSLTLEAAASIAGTGGVIYAPRRGSAFPVPGPVPANEELWLFVLEKSAPVAVVPIAALAPGVDRSVDARGGGSSSIIGWLQLTDDDRAAVASASGLLLPGVRAISGVETRSADSLPPLPLLHGAFVRVPNVAAGSAELRVEGRGWIPYRQKVNVNPGVTIVANPLLVRAAATLTVHWSTLDDLPALDRGLGACKETDSDPKLEIRISRCEALDSETCSPIREEKVEHMLGSVTLDELLPGNYRAELRFGKLPPISATTRVGPLQLRDLRLLATYFDLYGSVTHGGAPLGEDVQIQFPAGTGFAPAETEEYRAVLREPFREDAQITVAACDGSPRAIVLADGWVRRSTRFNIDIPANELAIHVSDTFTQEALSGATVRLEAMSADTPRRPVFNTTLKTDGEGNLVMKAVPVREIRLMVHRAGYERKSIEPFTMPKSDTHTVDVQLVPLRGTCGKVVSDRPFDGGVIVWFSPAGMETERADVAEDGTFAYENWHPPEETVTVVSRSHPLWVSRMPVFDRRAAIQLRFPIAPVRGVDVWMTGTVPANRRTHVGIVIGDVRVPQPVLAQHQILRGDSPVMRGAGTQRFHDLLATGPIEVLLGPTVEEVGYLPRGMDLFALPRFAEVPRQRLWAEGATAVIFAAPPGVP